MKVVVKWFLTGKLTTLEEADDLLSPQTSIAEVKGLLQIRFGFNVREILLIKDHLLENSTTLREVGVVGGASDPMLVAHVVRETELEASHIDVDDTTKDDDLQEFSHADYIMAMKMLGKNVAVPDDRLVQMRLNAPRQRPGFLNAPDPSPKAVAAASAASADPAPPPSMPGVTNVHNIPTYDPQKTRVFQIFAKVEYGLRKEGVDAEFAVNYPGVEAFPFWDMRTPDAFSRTGRYCEPGEVCLELFYFGEFAAVKDQRKFLTLMQQVLESKAGVRCRCPLPMREAGCMYPLVACPVVLHEMDAEELGQRFFEHFGERRTAPLRQKGEAGDEGVAGGGAGCAPQ